MAKDWWEDAPLAEQAGSWWEEAPIAGGDAPEVSAETPVMTSPQVSAVSPVVPQSEPSRPEPRMIGAVQPNLFTGMPDAPSSVSPLPPGAETGTPMGDLLSGYLGLRNAGDILAMTVRNRQAQRLDEMQNPEAPYQADPFGRYRTPESQAEADAMIAQKDAANIDALMRMAARDQQMSEIPTSEAAQRTFSADTWKGAWDSFLEAPGEVTRTAVLQSLPQSAPSIILATLGQIAGPGGAAGGAFLGSALTEAGADSAQKLNLVLREVGVDTSDPAAVEAFLTDNRDLIDTTFQQGLQRGGIIGAFDAVSAGIVGKLAAGSALSASRLRRASTPALGTGIEGVGGGSGEAAAQYAETGQINPGEVFAEALGEVGSGGAQALGQTVIELMRNQPQQPNPPAQDTAATPPGSETPVQAGQAPVAPITPEVAVPPEPRRVPPRVEAPVPEAAPQRPMQDTPPAPQRVPPRVEPPAPPQEVPAQEAPQPLTATSVKRRNDPVEGPVTTVTLSNGKEVPISRQDPASSWGIGGWWRDDVQARPGEPGGYLGATRQEAIDELIRQETENERRASQEAVPAGRDEPAGQGAVRPEAEPVTEPPAAGTGRPVDDGGVPAGDGAEQVTGWRQLGGTMMANSPEGRLMEVVEQNGQYVARVDGQEVGTAPTLEQAQEIARTNAKRIAGEAAQAKAQQTPVETPLGRSQRIEQAMKQDTVEQERVRDDTYEPQSFIDNLIAEQTDNVNAVAPGSAKAARERFERDMDEIANTLESLGITEESEDVPTVRYTLRRPSGETKYTLPGTPEGIRDFAKRMGKTIPIETSYGNAKAPITAEQLIADRMGQITDRSTGERRSAAPRDVTDEMVAELGQELGRPNLKRTDKVGVSTPPAPSSIKKKVTPTNKFSDAGALPTQLDADSQPEPKTTGRTQPKGTLGPSFLDFSFTNKNSVFGAAFRAAGFDPDKARLFSVDRQLAILRKVIKDKYGIEVVMPTRRIMKKTITGRKRAEVREQIGARDAIDQLLDAYRQLEMMAHMMGIPSEALALKDKKGNGIRLSLNGKRMGALGMYVFDPSTGQRTIHLPGRSNSFAHEWGHALDHWLGLYLYDGTDREVRQLLSIDMHTEGVDPADTKSERLAKAMVQLMQAMFEDGAKMAAMQIELVQRATATKNGEPTPDAKKAQAILDDLARGKKPPEEVMNRYFLNAEEFDEIYGTRGYFQSPHEMLARAFEAYIGSRAEGMSDLPGGFLAKPSWAYTGSEEARAKMTFPRGTSAAKIFGAIDNLAQQLATAEIMGTNAAQKPADADIYDIRKWDKWHPKDSLWERERDIWQSAKAAKREIDNGPSAAQKTLDAVEYYTSTMSGYLRGIARRQESKRAQRALQNVLDMFMTDPGSGRTIRDVWEESVERIAKRNTNRLQNISDNFNLGNLSDAENAELRRLLTQPDYKTNNQRLQKAAAALRIFMDDIWRYIDSSGVKVGYVRNGYLPRILDTNAMMADSKGFMQGAAKAYRKVFQRDVRQEDDLDTQIDDMKSIIRQLMRAKRPTETGDEVVRDLLRYDPEAGDAINAWMKARKAMSRLRSKLKEAKKTKDEEKIQKAQEKLNEFMESEFMEVHENLLDILERIYADERADNWYHRVMSGNSMDFDTKGPSTTFTKKREMPPETDEYLADFYQSDVMLLIQDYAQMAPRRAEYVKRAGVNSEKLENMLDAAIRAGASSYDVKEIRRSINMLTGRHIDHQHSQSVWAGGWVYVGATSYLLRRAFFSSLAEPLSAGIRTGDARDSLSAIVSTIGGLVRGKKYRELGEVARIIGLITSAEHETIMLNRFGGDIDPNRAQGRMLSRFFRYTFLTQLTNLQRKQMLVVGDRVLRRHLRRVEEKNDAFSVSELADLGIDKSEVSDMRAWLEQKPGIPTADDLLGVDGDYFNKAAELYSAAQARFVQQVIQNPRRFTRPGAALDSRFRAMYGITGFIFSFHNNVLLPLFKKNIAPRLEDEGLAKFAARRVLGSSRNIMYALPAMAALYGGQMLALLLRTAIYNPDKFDELDDDELEEWLLKETLTRSGLTGAGDIPYNLYTGLKYGTDLAGFFAGPHKRIMLGWTEDVAMLGARNSENTDTAERAALKAAGEIVMEMGGTMMLSSLPGGPLTSPLYGASIFAWDAFDPAERFANWWYPKDD